jgi:N6-L-threonylcarbamoyladenine synthase
LYSQVGHAKYGGVVPELASRDHVNTLVPLMDVLFKQTQLSMSDLDGIAYTAGPGLIGALLVGACFAKSMALALNIPAIEVHHLEAHILAAFLDAEDLTFPFLALLVSGGHTQLIAVKALGVYQCLGETLDDAVGEAFDKTAKLMGIAYPGGALLAQLADGCKSTPYQFPRPMTNRQGLDFSFSGLKTHALTTWQSSAQDDEAKAHIAKAFQEAVTETLVIKCKRALKETGYTRLVVAGGVGANRALREALEVCIQNVQGKVYFPRLEYCTDNGAMVAYAGCMHRLLGEKDDHQGVAVKARWPLS